MKKIVFSDHAEERRRQRGFTTIEIELVVERPEYKKKRLDGRIEIVGTVRNRIIMAVYEEKENYIRIVSVI